MTMLLQTLTAAAAAPETGQKAAAARGKDKLDVLIISHYDKDHVGGAADVIRNIPIDVVYLPDYVGTGKKYKIMMKALCLYGRCAGSLQPG